MNKYHYPYIRAYGHMMGSSSYYIEDQIAQAQKDNAPKDAWAYSLTDKKWMTLFSLREKASKGNMVAQSTLEKLEKKVKK